MTDLERWLQPKVLVSAFAASLGFALISILLYPQIYDASTKVNQNSITILLTAGAAIVALVLVLALLAYFFQTAKEFASKPTKMFLSVFGGLLLLVLLLCAAALVISALYGLLAVLINAILKGSLSFGQIKGVINLVTTLITLALAPFLLNIVFTYGSGERGVPQAIRQGIQIAKACYLKFLIVAVAGTALGWIIGLPFRYLSGALPFQMVKAILEALAGMLILVCALAVYTETKREAD